MRQVRHHKAGSSQADKVSASTFVEFKRYSLVVINGRLFKLNFDGRQFPYPRNDSKLIRLVEVVVDLTGDDVPLIILDLQGSVHGGIDSGILVVRSRGSGNDGCTLAIGEVAGGRDGVTVFLSSLANDGSGGISTYVSSIVAPPARSYFHRISHDGMLFFGVTIRAYVFKTLPYFPLSIYVLTT